MEHSKAAVRARCNRELCAGPLAVDARISPAVQDGKYDYAGTLDQEIDEVGKSTQHRTMNFAMDSRINPWVVGETREKIRDSAAELGTKTRLLLVVPVLGLFEVTFRQASNNDVVIHLFERRSATSLHGDSAEGFF